MTIHTDNQRYVRLFRKAAHTEWIHYGSRAVPSGRADQQHRAHPRRGDALLRKKTGTQFGLVPYRGAAPAMQDVLAGQIDAMFLNIAAALPQVASGSVKALGVTSEKRMAVAPEIPTMDEAGLRGFYFRFWAALFAPRGTPSDIIDKLNGAAVKTLTDPSVRRKLEAQGFEIPPPDKQTPEALAAFQKAEIEKWWPIIKEAGITPQ
jgi:tripartite-type tricarboxylate transporter receptor subunit TctC